MISAPITFDAIQLTNKHTVHDKGYSTNTERFVSFYPRTSSGQALLQDVNKSETFLIPSFVKFSTAP